MGISGFLFGKVFTENNINTWSVWMVFIFQKKTVIYEADGQIKVTEQFILSCLWVIKLLNLIFSLFPV